MKMFGLCIYMLAGWLIHLLLWGSAWQGGWTITMLCLWPIFLLAAFWAIILMVIAGVIGIVFLYHFLQHYLPS